MGALEPAALLRSPRPDFTDPADLERYLSTVRKEDLPSVSASLSAQADQAEAACWEQIPRMDVDREVSSQITAVDAMLAEVCATAAASCGGLG